MKFLHAALALLLVCSCAQSAGAQETRSWVRVAPTGERFTVLMPQNPVITTQKKSYQGLSVEARLYKAVTNDIEYAVWSLKNSQAAAATREDAGAYLDACADLVWESLLQPLREKLPKRPEIVSQMTYQGELESNPLPGREYLITLGNRPGVTHFFVDGERIYVLTVLNAPSEDADARRFINSFSVRTPKVALPAPATIEVDPRFDPADRRQNSTQPQGVGLGSGESNGIGPGRGGNTGGAGPEDPGAGANTDYDRIFSPREVTQKARLLSRPEPQYTESARKYAVQGTILLRAVMSREGQLTNIKVIKGLPHGLTQSAIAAARRINFTPAMKDGRAVSQYIQIEYNFNLY